MAGRAFVVGYTTPGGMAFSTLIIHTGMAKEEEATLKRRFAFHQIGAERKGQ
tara:strand:+ start:391 stop:546 length:156 start_codon:yes stop_codon:yes gene_type:complete